MFEMMSRCEVILKGVYIQSLAFRSCLLTAMGSSIMSIVIFDFLIMSTGVVAGHLGARGDRSSAFALLVRTRSVAKFGDREAFVRLA